MSFAIRRIHKWADNIEMQLTDELMEVVEENYGKDLIDLTEEEIRDVFEYAEKVEEQYPLFAMCLRNIVHSWEADQEEEYIF